MTSKGLHTNGKDEVAKPTYLWFEWQQLYPVQGVVETGK
ncbi:hypothetical protein M514_08133 [Trichuris suis]|uniref:Uncharacterized protein n=1 Tax=Trichuris suis TaxID=68888 RepID=A0A085NQY0_9BILA|nr:hypothetical protein M513_08133 [Trichuris suis]KFD71876.1 hypothetical protein M514_08133 [Trichuris suis]